MSQTGPNDDHLIPFANKFIDESRYKQNTIFVAKGVSASEVKFESAFSVLNLQGKIDKTNNTFKDGVLHLDVPMWGLFEIAKDISGDLGQGISGNVDVGEVAKGTFKLSLDQEKPQDIVISYDLKARFTDQLNDTLSLLTLTDERVKNALIDDLDDGETTIAKLSVEEEAGQLELLEQFLEDHVVDLNHFVVESYKPSAGLASSSSSYTFDAVVFSVLQFVGAISPGAFALNGALYIRIPVWGRVRLAGLVGDLVKGIELKINALVAKGSIRLYLKDSGKQALRADINLMAKFIGRLQDDLLIVSLPF